MPVGELFLSAFLQVLFDRLTSPELWRLASQLGVRSKLRKWDKTFKMIQALLSDAEEKQLTNKSVKIWLDELQHLAYDVEDILDEFSTEVLGRQIMAKNHASTSKIRNFIPAVKLNVRMWLKIKGVTSRLEELFKQRNDLGLREIGGGTSTVAYQRPPSSSLPTESFTYGRNEEKMRILDMVSSGEVNGVAFQVIPIVGMGGIGKTTLAQLVFNDDAMKDFERKAWVCVSDDSDVLSISRGILESITHSPCDLNHLDTIQIELRKEIARKKFILVLDDVWEMDYGSWQRLKAPFMEGTTRSVILVTTRIEEVASTIAGSANYHGLKPLSDEDCWSVFKMHAFANRNVGLQKNLEQIHKNVIEKCKGLPLAARTLGGLLHSKPDDEWDGILKSNIWDLSDAKGEIPAVLKLSYHHLPSHVKRCFAYCAILPKDYEFQEKELVLLWMSEGLLMDDKQPEDLGKEYFQVLLSRSIFQRSSNNGAKFVMHDLVNDLAQWVSGETSFRLEDNELKISERARHFSYTCDYCEGRNKFQVFNEVQCLRLRTFLPVAIRVYFMHNFIRNIVISDLIPSLKRLRVLSLRNYYITELPDSVGCLRHLRQLDLSYTMIETLPKSTSSLYNLQILLLRDCSRLKKLPSDFGNLINLRHLDIRGARLIRDMPLGMEELENLHTLSDFVVGKDNCAGLKELKNLNSLCGELYISGLENATDFQDMKGGILCEKKDLEVLLLEWTSQFHGSRNEVVEKDLLDILRPHKNLKQLAVKCYGGTRFSSWIGDPLFSKLVLLRLESCEKCVSLPSLGQLPVLKDLTIIGIKGVKSIGSEFYGESFSNAFQSLETLSFDGLQEWEHWDPLKENEHVEIFPRLRKLSIRSCPKLSKSLPDRLPSLEELWIENCPELVVSFSCLPKLCQLSIDGCKRMVCSSPIGSNSLNKVTLLHVSVSENWLEHLNAVNCEILYTRLEKPPQGLHSLTSLKKLSIQNCSSLVSFREVYSHSTLSELEIENCNALTFILRAQLPPSLKRLTVTNCEKLKRLFDDGEDTCISSSMMGKVNFNNTITPLLDLLCIRNCPSLVCLSSTGLLPTMLTRLEIIHCPKLELVAERFPTTLTYLNIWSCSKLESITERFHTNTSLEDIRIWQCDNLKCIPEGLHNLSGLRWISVRNCPSLVSFPEGGLPNSNLEGFSIEGCEKLQVLPNNMHNLNSLQSLDILGCPSIVSFPKEGFPTSLTILGISVANNVNFYKQVIEWGLHKLTSLRQLWIYGGCPDEMSFPREEEMGMMLPTSLTHLRIKSFPNMIYLSSKGFQNLTSLTDLWIHDCPSLTSFPKGFQNLTSLESLSIYNCPNLTSFPKSGLPCSLLTLSIFNCPLLKKHCKRGQGKEWSKISHIPCVEIDGRFIYDPLLF